MYDIIVCGASSIDVFVKTDASVLQDHEKKMIAYPMGSKILIENLEFHIGGGATNVLATFRAQDLTSAYIGRLGKDTNGHKIFSWLKEQHIDFLGQVSENEKEATGYGVVLDTHANDRSILVFRGANNELEFSKIPQHLLKAKWFFSSAMMGKSKKTLEKLFMFMKHHGIKTALNPNNIMVKEGFLDLKNILKHVDVLILNKEEAIELLNLHDASNQKIMHTAAHTLSTFGPEIVAITDGAKGIYVYSKEEEFELMPTANRKVVETTGAGDAFSSGFVTGLVKNFPLRKAAQLGLFNAEKVIQHIGTKSVLTKEETTRLFAS